LEPLPGIPHDDLLKLVFSFGILLGTARLFAEIARRIKLPAVVGEILAGVVLGPSLLSGLFPRFGAWIVPETALQGQLLDLVGLIGIMFLLVVVGLETDLALIRTRFRAAVGVGLGGLVIPFGFGLVFALAFPDDLLVDPTRRDIFALFLAVSLALSAIPVLAKILADMNLMRTRFGQTALAAGMIDDILGWTLLGIVTSLAAARRVTAGSVAETVGAVVIFFLATVVVARPLARWTLRVVQERFGTRDMMLTLLVVLAFGWGAFSHALDLEPILGAFAIGIIFSGMRRFPTEVGRGLESVTYGVFAPVFLATAGLRLSMGDLLEPELLRLTGLLLLVAVVAKMLGAFIGARFFASSTIRESLGFGVALNARGVLGIIVASIGLSMGILSTEVYSMVVVTSVITSLMAPIGLKLVLGREPVGEIDREQGVLASVRRVLLSVRPREEGGSHVQSLEVAVISSLAAELPAVTLFTVAEPKERRHAERYLNDLAKTFPAGVDVRTRVARGDPTTRILEEANRGYDLLAMGSPEDTQDSSHLFGSVVDEVVRLAPCPSMIFTSRQGQWPPRRIMVPTNGSPPAARAADLAFSLAGDDASVLLFHVVDPAVATEMSTSRGGSATVRMEIGEDIVDELAEIGEGRGVNVVAEVAMGRSAVSAVVDRAGRNVDLIIIGTGVRSGSQRLYLGPKVELLLRDSPCSVIVLNT
jgi:Kef-type K+ transport system membrane component KefB/nucleotide-binding universal stress UspA family protein